MKRWGLLLLFVALLWDASTFTEGVREGLSLCIDLLIPSLWIFLVLSGLLVNAFVDWTPPKWCDRLCQKLFRLPGGILPIFLMGCCGGYPIGAKLTAEFGKSAALSDESKTNLLALSVCASPSFLIAGFSIPVFHHPLPGVFLWLSSVFACIVTALLFADRSTRIKLPKRTKTPHSSPNLSAIMRQSLLQMGMICGYVLIFSGIGALLGQLPLASTLRASLMMVLELTAGSQECIHISWPFSYLSMAAAASFGGICIQGQLFSILGKEAPEWKHWLVRRLVHAGISVACSALWIPFLQQTAACFQSGTTIAVSDKAAIITPILLWMAMLTALLLAGQRSHSPLE